MNRTRLTAAHFLDRAAVVDADYFPAAPDDLAKLIAPAAPTALHIHVEIWQGDTRVTAYTMNHDDPAQRRALGARVRDAFAAGQLVVTYPVTQS